MENKIYYSYSEFLKNKYGERVYKLPVNLTISCPNREDGGKGCTYCGEAGAGFEVLPSTFSIEEQILANKDYIGKRYKVNKFIVYFQNFTNTYMPLEDFKKCMNSSVFDFVCEIAVSTRPDCIRKEYLEVLKDIKLKFGINITIELGLQSVNYHSLLKVKRGHTLAEYIEAALLIKQYGFELCTHIILNLPWDNLTDTIETAKFVSALKTDTVKLHALYIVKESELCSQYENKEFEICSVEDYKERVITFLEYLSPDIAIQRLIGRAPKSSSVFANWSQSWWKIRDEIDASMLQNKRFQGKSFNYLGGSRVKKFF